jgi:hypothetical protein
MLIPPLLDSKYASCVEQKCLLCTNEFHLVWLPLVTGERAACMAILENGMLLQFSTVPNSDNLHQHYWGVQVARIGEW